MNKTEEIVDLIHQLVIKIQNREKRPNNYGTGDLLYRFEIHTIHAIYKNPGITASELSNMFSVTKGAISQIITKLTKKGFIQKDKDPVTNKIIFLTLTLKGTFIAKKHIEFHERILNGIAKVNNKDKKENLETFYQLLKTFNSKL
jgi:DNA-binding MarR family transcriptional regulator